MALDIKAAEHELDTQHYLAIQKATAWKWASRYVVAFRKDDPKTDSYHDEFVEHAALADVEGDFLKEVMDAVDMELINGR